MTITQTTLRGGEQKTYAARTRKWAEVKNLATDGSENGAMCIKVNDLRLKQFNYLNKSLAETHTVRIYHCPDRTIPTALTDGNVGKLYETTVAPSTMSPPLELEGDYVWLIFSLEGVAESDIGDLYFEGTMDG